MFNKYLIPLAALATSVLSQSCTPTQVWGQCGGVGFTGCTTCTAGNFCNSQGAYYSQCIPGTGPTSNPPPPPSTTSRSTSTSTSSRPSGPSNPPNPPMTGYVKTSGQKFTLNGATYPLVGTNAWYLAQLQTTANINQTLQEIARMGATTVRTWGFNEQVQNPSGTYYQSWSGSTATLNTGANGLAKFDTVVSLAKANGLRLIVTLTNNWADYGGMDVYVKQILNSNNHDLFYTDATVKAAFKKYVQSFVNRYKNEPAILAWELGNEPRCTGTNSGSTGTCKPATITAWITEMSQYIKNLDSNHLVAIGDEGFGLTGGDSNPAYGNNDGLDFATNLKIASIDFGTVHLYPDWWSTPDAINWGNTWIKNHVAIQKSVNKPTVLEEFGVRSNQVNVYTSWLNTVITSGMTGDLVWQAGSRFPDGSTTPSQDGFGYFTGDAVYNLLTQHAAALKARG